jgi:diaminohydroxyphosphoribosylaminopyrimidine deaminase / 5-amino-6-(5-phosphoribosylamino)uracil reductase
MTHFAPNPAADLRFMQMALSLARRGLGNVMPNPAVGCVLVRDGAVIARGWTQPTGRPHAEEDALLKAGEQAKGATAYISLEPCCQPGRGGACTDGLLKAGIARVVIATEDPDPRVAGQGIKALRDAGVHVTTGICEDEARAVNIGFFHRIERHRPLVTVKVATSLDGRIATRTGDSRWVTDEPARAYSHRLRADHDALMIGSGTALADNPHLTCRLPGLENRSPIRIVMDGNLRLPLTSQLVNTAFEVPVWVFTSDSADHTRIKAYRECGVEVIPIPREKAGYLDLSAVMARLAVRGVTRLLVEGGGMLIANILRHNLADRLEWFRAASIIGGDGIPAAASLGIEKLVTTPRFTLTDSRTLGADRVESYVLREG